MFGMKDTEIFYFLWIFVSVPALFLRFFLNFLTFPGWLSYKMVSYIKKYVYIHPWVSLNKLEIKLNSQLNLNLTQAWGNPIDKVKGVDSKQNAWSLFKSPKIVFKLPLGERFYFLKVNLTRCHKYLIPIYILKVCS